MKNLILRSCLGGRSPEDPAVRRRCGTISGTMGIALNLILFLSKFIAGLMSSSVAMMADAVNNLSDAATSVVTLVGFRLAGQEADAEHPFGHGRIEYITGFIVAMAILLMGFEVAGSAVDALLHPQQLQFSLPSLVILCAAIGVKLWMFFFNWVLGRAIGSPSLEATAADSLSDTMSTSMVLLSTLADHYLDLRVDALAGLLVALLIFKAGWETAKGTLDPLLGRPMDPELATHIDELVLRHDFILGIHDLVYHDYGPGRAMMSFHAEVPSDGDFLAIHDMIDHIERQIKDTYHIETVIHMDPIVQDARTESLRGQVAAIAQDLDPRLSIHDFRITAGPLHTNLIFDVVVPFGFRLSDDEVRAELGSRIKALSPQYFSVIHVDHTFVSSSD